MRLLNKDKPVSKKIRFKSLGKSMCSNKSLHKDLMTPTSKDIKLKQKNTENYSVILMGAVESNRVSTDKRGVGVNSVVQTSDLASCIKKVQSPIAISNSKFSARG